MNLHEDINRIKEMMGLNEDTTPFELFGITENLVGYESGPFALYAHLFAKLYKAYRKGNLEKEYEILMSNENVSRKMVNYFYDFIINNDEYFQEQEKGVFTENINRIKEMMNLNEDDKKTISYSAVVLDHESSELLLDTFNGEIPDGWKKYGHHMTIALGKAVEDENLMGSVQTLIVTQIGISDMAVAVRVEGFPSKNKIPHITLAVNPEGGKPFMSNKIEEWKDIVPFEITGEVRNIYNI